MPSTISDRGLALAAKMPIFFDVLRNLWDPESNPGGIVNLGLAENALLQTEMAEFINARPRANSHALTYGDGFSGSIKLKEALCHFLTRHLNPCKPLEPAHISVTAGASNALECCAWSLCDPGDFILVGRPYWTTFRGIFGNRASIGVLEVNNGNTDPFGLEAVGHFREAYTKAIGEGKRIRAILLCSPNNPLGRCYPEDVLKSYMRLCQELDLHLISDELYALSVWDSPGMDNAVPFTSVLSIDPEGLVDPRMVHAVWGMSKDFGATGLRIGCLISQANTAFLNACESISLFNFPSSLADKTVTSFLMDDEFTDKLISLNRARLADNYQHVTKFLDSHGIPYTNSNAALFVWINLGAAVEGKTIADDKILENLGREKLYLSAGSVYASEEPGWFRVVIAHPKYVLDEGLKRMLSAVRQAELETSMGEVCINTSSS